MYQAHIQGKKHKYYTRLLLHMLNHIAPYEILNRFCSKKFLNSFSFAQFIADFILPRSNREWCQSPSKRRHCDMYRIPVYKLFTGADCQWSECSLWTVRHTVKACVPQIVFRLETSSLGDMRRVQVTRVQSKPCLIMLMQALFRKLL